MVIKLTTIREVKEKKLIEKMIRSTFPNYDINIVTELESSKNNE